MALGLLGVVAAVTAAAILLLGVVAATHRARSAADLAALAGAQALARGDSAAQACTRAGATAAANGARAAGCEVTGLDLVLDAQVEVPGPLRGLGPARARARAGPDRVE